METFYNFIGYFYPSRPVLNTPPSGLISEIKNFNNSNLKKTVVKPPNNFHDTELKRLLGAKFKNVIQE
jgi:hypothetical protein